MAMISGTASTRFLLLLTLSAVMFEVGTVRVAALGGKVAELQVQRWREKLPEVGLPESIAGALSPLTEAELHHFGAAVRANKSVNATQFCKSADLSCGQVMPVLAASVFAYGRGFADEAHMFLDAAELREGGHVTLPDLHPPVTWKSFLPRELAETMPPFSAGNLTQLLTFLGIPRGSNVSRNMLSTLEACEGRLEEGEARTCCTSVECMVDYVVSVLGSDVELLSDTSVVGSGQRATVRKAKKRENVSGKAPMACHRLVFAYGVLYCHYFSGTEAFDVELEVTQNRSVVSKSVTAVCHYFSKGGKAKGGALPRHIWFYFTMVA